MAFKTCMISEVLHNRYCDKNVCSSYIVIHNVNGVGLTASQQECGGFITCRHVDSIVKACVAISRVPCLCCRPSDSEDY